jgi:hypothetical protein
VGFCRRAFRINLAQLKQSYVLASERLDFESPQQKPLDGEALASMQNRVSETRGSRIEANENIFPGVGSRDFRLNYQNTLDFLPLVSKISIIGFYHL